MYDLSAFDISETAVTLADIGASAAKAYFVRIAVVGANCGELLLRAQSETCCAAVVWPLRAFHVHHQSLT